MEQDFMNTHMEEYNIFNEPEILFHSHYIEPTFHYIKNYNEQKSGVPFKLDFDDASIPLSDSQKICPECGNMMIKHNRELVFSEMDIIPNQLKTRNYVRYVYICKSCQINGLKIRQKTPNPYPIIKKCIVSPDTIAYLIKCKYIDFQPVRDIERAYDNAFLPINRNIMSNWIIQAATNILLPFYELLKSELTLSSTILYSKIKPLILRNENRLLKPDITILAYEKPKESDKPVILYTYSTPREGFPPQSFLKTYTGNLVKLDSASEALSDFNFSNPARGLPRYIISQIRSKKWVLADNYKHCSDINKCCYVIYSIIKTAEANGVEPYNYIKYLLKNLTCRNKKSKILESIDLLPWMYISS